jgi:hypothetical protein
MLKRAHHTMPWPLLLGGALALTTACSGEDGGDAGVDGGVDSGVVADSGVVQDAGFRDAGFPDSGPPRDGGHYCTTNGAVTVDGEAVPVGEPSTIPVTSAGTRGVLSCIDRPPNDNPAFINELCFTECLDFFGATPSEGEIQALDVAVFLQTLNGAPVDPSYDYATGQDRMPEGRTAAGFRITANAQDCDSGWQVELGYSNQGAVLSAETRYIVRVRTATTAKGGVWPTEYLYDFIRRNDQVPMVSVCGNAEQRIPGREFVFPVVPASLLASAATAAGNVTGADDLFDGLGSGHALLEARDCTGGGGISMAHTTGGFLPAPAGAFYLDDELAVDSAATETAGNGLYLGVGFPGNTATSSATVQVSAAIGATTDGTCTEEFGGLEIPVFSDGVTFVRMNRETVLHGR